MSTSFKEHFMKFDFHSSFVRTFYILRNWPVYFQTCRCVDQSRFVLISWQTDGGCNWSETNVKKARLNVDGSGPNVNNVICIFSKFAVHFGLFLSWIQMMFIPVYIQASLLWSQLALCLVYVHTEYCDFILLMLSSLWLMSKRLLCEATMLLSSFANRSK